MVNHLNYSLHTYLTYVRATGLIVVCLLTVLVGLCGCVGLSHATEGCKQHLALLRERLHKGGEDQIYNLADILILCKEGKHCLAGKSKDEVNEILGPPKGVSENGRRHSYLFSHDFTLENGRATALSIWFDERGMVSFFGTCIVQPHHH